MRTIILFCIVWIPVFCYAQQSFLELDSVFIGGAKMIDQGRRENALSCLWQKRRNEMVYLTPYEARAYSINGTVYVARDIEINGNEGRFFLERMAHGDLTLYYFKNKGNHYFIENDSAFMKLTKRNEYGKKHYKETLHSLCADCEYTNN